jgi:hypothetical protein
MVVRLTPQRRENNLEIAVSQQIEELTRMTVRELRQKYIEVFGEASRSNHKQFLFRRIAWRIQALAEGGLSERAHRRALEIADDADLRIRAPKTFFHQDTTLPRELSAPAKVVKHADDRLPPPGSLLRRRYKDKDVIVRVLADGFEYDQKVYHSLSAVAHEVTHTKWNGFLFFHVGPNERADA